MSRSDHVALMARYNRWMNERLYRAAATLPAAELARDRGAFFGSILGTLNHLLVADLIWLRRFAAAPGAHPLLAQLQAMPVPSTLDATLFDGLDALAAARGRMDALIEAWSGALDEAALATPLRYRNTAGKAFERETFGLLMHLFNHQTHHRGQVTTLLSQADVDMGVTDLLALLPVADAPAADDGTHPH